MKRAADGLAAGVAVFQAFVLGPVIFEVERTLFLLQYIRSPELRRCIPVGLNKGEAKNSLARAVFFNRLGELLDRTHENLRHRASGLNLVVAAIVLWNTVYLEQAVAAIRQSGQAVSDETLAHLSPLKWAHINLTGDYHWRRPTGSEAANRARSEPADRALLRNAKYLTKGGVTSNGRSRQSTGSASG